MNQARNDVYNNKSLKRDVAVTTILRKQLLSWKVQEPTKLEIAFFFFLIFGCAVVLSSRENTNRFF